jgi:hypothetical protein
MFLSFALFQFQQMFTNRSASRAVRGQICRISGDGARLLP